MTKSKAGQASPQRTAYLVLGAHRSGTSAVTQLLALAGADLPANLMPGDEHNAKGYFEPWKIALMNDARLHAAGSAWDDAFAFPFKSLPEADEREWIDHAKALMQAEYGDAAFPLLKDPRISVLGPLWLQVLAEAGLDARCVLPVRHPGAVAGSLTRRDGFSPQKSLLVWTGYMLGAEAMSRGLPRAFLDYDALLADWRAEVARVERQLGGALPALTPAAGAAIDDFLAPELRHNTAEGDLASFGWAGALTARVHAWFAAAARGRAPSTNVLDEVADDLRQRGEAYGALVSPAARDLDIARREARELAGKLAFEQAQAIEERAKLEAARADDREILERGWRRDVRGLEARLAALRQECLDAGRALDAILADD